METNFNIDTETNLNTVLTRLQSNIDKKRFVRTQKTYEKPFEGSLNGNLFKIKLLSYGYGSTIPLIKGIVKQTSYGVNVKVTMSISTGPLIIFILWSLLWFFFLLIIVTNMIDTPILIFVLPIYVILGMVLLYYNVKGIKKGFEDSRETLTRVIKGKEPQNPYLIPKKGCLTLFVFPFICF